MAETNFLFEHTSLLKKDADNASAVDTNYPDEANQYAHSAYNNAYNNTQIIKIDVRTIRESLGVKTAILKLKMFDTDASVGLDISFNKMVRTDWAYDQATFNIYKTGSNWGTAGAGNTSTDIETSSPATVTHTVGSGENGTWVSIDITNIVKDAIDNVSGIVYLRVAGEQTAGNSAWGWRGISYATEADRPYLVVDEYDPEDNLVAYWKLDESSGNAVDSVGSMELVNTNVTYDTGKINNGALFNASTDYLKTSTGDGASFDFERTDTFSYSFWVKPTSLADNQYIISRQKSGANYTGWSFLQKADGGANIVLANNADGSNLIFGTLPAGTFANGTWCHIVVTYSGSSNISGLTAYKNGLPVTITSVFNNLSASTKQTLGLDIGNRDTSNFGCNSIVDEVGIWSRALSAREVSILYNSNRALAYPLTTPSLYGGVSYWKMDESSGDAADSIGSNTATETDVTYDTGKINNAATLNGSSSKFVLTSAPLSGNNSFTVSGWIKRTSDTFPANGMVIFGQGANSASASTGVTLFSATQARFIIYGGDITVTFNNSINTWYHLVITFDGVTARIYANGTELGSGARTLAITSANPSFGTFTNNLNGWVVGQLDEIGIFNRALSSTEVSELYRSGSGIQYPWIVTTEIKSINGLAYASIKSKNGVAIASVKSVNGLE